MVSEPSAPKRGPTRFRRSGVPPLAPDRARRQGDITRLAFHLLEPTSDDGVVTWNVLDDWLADGTEVAVYRVLR